jgi:hypothetical protein
MESGADGANSDDNRLDPRPDTGDSRRLGNPTRLVPRQAPPEDPIDVTPYPAEFEDEVGPPRRLSPFEADQLGPMFGPRIQVWGCSPGCLIVSLVASVVLTLLLNAMF